MGGGKLECERQAVERNADLGDRARVAGRELEAVRGGLRSRDEERDSLVARQRLEVAHVDAGRKPEWGNGVGVLAGEVQNGAARDEHGQARCSREQLADDQGGVIDPLEVVEHEQQRPAP